MSKNSNMARYRQFKDWQYFFNRVRKSKPRKKKQFNPTAMYYVDQQGKVVFVDDEE